MRSLFLKIFLWFWAAMALVVLALIIATATTQSDPVEARWRYMTGTAVSIYAQTAAEVYERGGHNALVIYLRRVEQSSRMRTALYDERSGQVWGRGTSDGTEHFAEVARRARHNDETLFEFSARPQPVALVAHRVNGAGGVYVLVGEMPRDRFSWLLAEPDALVFRLMVVLLTAGLVCYGLARYLAAPVETLRAGVRRLAGGDLSARVGARVGTRRDEIADLSHDFDRMAERIESLVTSQRRLLGDISHELRSPLARLSVALGLARRRAGGEDAQGVTGALDRIEREAERLNELIGQLLTLTRLETDEDELQRTPIDLQDLVRQVAADADFEAQPRNRGVRVVADEECSFAGDAELLRSAIENVVRNGVRYTAEHTNVEVSLRCPAGGGDSGIRLTVRDHGRGVPEEALKDIFRPFYRVADARERRTGGTGLGLAIAERAVRLHGGTAEAANAGDGGLVVELRLPAPSVRPQS